MVIKSDDHLDVYYRMTGQININHVLILSFYDIKQIKKIYNQLKCM